VVLVGSIFFAGHRIVRDPVRGLFDRERAAALLDRGRFRCQMPRFIDVIGDGGGLIAVRSSSLRTPPPDPDRFAASEGPPMPRHFTHE
jgi:tetrahydromethanopterin S-methyltransferase subunit H